MALDLANPDDRLHMCALVFLGCSGLVDLYLDGHWLGQASWSTMELCFLFALWLFCTAHGMHASMRIVFFSRHIIFFWSAMTLMIGLHWR